MEMTEENETTTVEAVLSSEGERGNESFPGSPSSHRYSGMPERLLEGCAPDALLAAAALVGALAYPPLAKRGLILHRCAFRELTGFPCPTCGMTRSLALAVRGRWVSAFRQHFLGPPLLLLVLARLALFWRLRREVSDGPHSAALIVGDREKRVLAGTFLAAWVLRVLLFGRDADQDEAFWEALGRQ